MVHRPTPEFPAHLNALYRNFRFERSLAQDPLSWVRPLAGRGRPAEIAGAFASTLAIGNTTAIRGALETFRAKTGADLEGFVASSPGDLSGRLDGFKHRWIRADQLVELAQHLDRIYRSYDLLEDVFREGFAPEAEFAGGLDAMAKALREGSRSSLPRGYAHLFPSPLDASKSACKRLTLFVRWMVRTEYPDLGTWSRVSPAVLRIPLDQHVFWIAYHLGLTHRRTRNWATVEEVTAALRRIDPADPVKYDFVLCHTGISGDCPKRRDLSVCGPCVVRPDCLMWRGRRAS